MSVHSLTIWFFILYIRILPVAAMLSFKRTMPKINRVRGSLDTRGGKKMATFCLIIKMATSSPFFDLTNPALDNCPLVIKKMNKSAKNVFCFHIWKRLCNFGICTLAGRNFADSFGTVQIFVAFTTALSLLL
jgi:hypothetical protein